MMASWPSLITWMSHTCHMITLKMIFLDDQDDLPRYQGQTDKPVVLQILLWIFLVGGLTRWDQHRFIEKSRWTKSDILDKIFFKQPYTQHQILLCIAAHSKIKKWNELICPNLFIFATQTGHWYPAFIELWELHYWTGWIQWILTLSVESTLCKKYTTMPQKHTFAAYKIKFILQSTTVLSE